MRFGEPRRLCATREYRRPTPLLFPSPRPFRLLWHEVRRAFNLHDRRRIPLACQRFRLRRIEANGELEGAFRLADGRGEIEASAGGRRTQSRTAPTPAAAPTMPTCPS